MVWTNLIFKMMETVRMEPWDNSYWEATTVESSIMKAWGINGPMQCLGKLNGATRITASEDIWYPPPSGFFKLEFDEAFKGNPGPVGYGCIVRDHQGRLQRFKIDFMGLESNNATEFEGLF